MPAPGPLGPPELPAPPNMQPFWLALALLVAFLCGIALENARNTHILTSMPHACRCGEAPPDGRFSSSFSLTPPPPYPSPEPPPCPTPDIEREWDVPMFRGENGVGFWDVYLLSNLTSLCLGGKTVRLSDCHLIPC